MSLAIKYESVEDAQLRLKDSVVLYKGRPVYIEAVSRAPNGENGPYRVYMKDLPLANEPMRNPRIRDPMALEQEQKRKFISSKHFDIAPFPMGYVNFPDYVGYCTRAPHRVQKQGLCEDNFYGLKNDGTGLGFGVVLRYKEIVDCVLNKYPTFDEALEMLKKRREVAFCRDFCVLRDPALEGLTFLYYRTKKVGWFAHNDFELGEKFQCLRESLGEMRKVR